MGEGSIPFPPCTVELRVWCAKSWRGALLVEMKYFLFVKKSPRALSSKEWCKSASRGDEALGVISLVPGTIRTLNSFKKIKEKKNIVLETVT